MTLSSRFNVIENKIHFSYMDFAGTIEVDYSWIEENEFELKYCVSITKNGVDFVHHFYNTLEEAFKFIEEYNEQMEAEKRN